jgi:hypothetical protein
MKFSTLCFTFIFTVLLIQFSACSQDQKHTNTLKPSDIYGQYVIDQTMFKGFEAYWQYDHYRFKINHNKTIEFYSTEGDDIMRTDVGKVEFNKTPYGLEIKLDIPGGCHILSESPLIRENKGSFYLVFKSSKWGNVYFKKGKYTKHTLSDFLELGKEVKENDTITVKKGTNVMFRQVYSSDKDIELFMREENDSLISWRSYGDFNRVDEFHANKTVTKIYTIEAEKSGFQKVMLYNSWESRKLTEADHQKFVPSKEIIAHEFDSVFNLIKNEKRVEKRKMNNPWQVDHPTLFGKNWPLDYLAQKYFGCHKQTEFIKELCIHKDKDGNTTNVPGEYDWYWYFIWEDAVNWYYNHVPFHPKLKYICFWLNIK